MFGVTKTLIVVYKDEMLINQLKKLVETNDDGDNGDVVGTTDGSINIVAWSEKVWLGNKKAGNIKDKILFLGDIKGTDKLIPIIDVVFNDYGVKFGWAGNQAVLYCSIKEIASREVYNQFLDEIVQLPIPEMLKKSQMLKPGENLEEEKTIADNEEEKKELKEEKKSLVFFEKARNVLSAGADMVEKAGNAVMIKAGDTFKDRNVVRRQMLFYGVVKLYNDGLEKFMNM